MGYFINAFILYIMKKVIHSIIALMLSATVFAQAPQSFKYQAVARDASGEVIANQQAEY